MSQRLNWGAKFLQFEIRYFKLTLGVRNIYYVPRNAWKYVRIRGRVIVLINMN